MHEHEKKRDVPPFQCHFFHGARYSSPLQSLQKGPKESKTVTSYITFPANEDENIEIGNVVVLNMTSIENDKGHT